MAEAFYDADVFEVTPVQGRWAECSAIDTLLDRVRAGDGGVLLVRGEAGIGKSALLDYAAARASYCHVVRASGAPAETPVAFAGLHRLCAPMLDADTLGRLPEPQRDALRALFGMASERSPDPLLIGVATLGLLLAAASERPLVCLVDDAHRLDPASLLTLAFVARRLSSESVAVIFVTAPETPDALDGLPELAVGRLSIPDAHTLLDSLTRSGLDRQIRDRVVAEARGNPLALIEVSQGLAPAEIAGGFGLVTQRSLAQGGSDDFRQRLASLPVDSRKLLLLAATDPMGDPALVWRAARRLGISPAAADAADLAGWLEFRAQLTFRHPLMRSVVYQAVTHPERREAHRALAEAASLPADGAIRAWHLGQASPGPDDDVALELELSAGQVHARAGPAARAEFLERSAVLTMDPTLRAKRSLAAAEAKAKVGAFGEALQLLSAAEAGPLADDGRGQADRLRGKIAFALQPGDGEAARLLLRAARRFEPLDGNTAREIYAEALAVASALCSAGPDTPALLTVPPGSDLPRTVDLLVDGLVLLNTEGYPAATPILREALNAFVADTSGESTAPWLSIACHVALMLWEDEALDLLTSRQLQLIRERGVTAMLPLALGQRSKSLFLAGRLSEVSMLAAEMSAVIKATGVSLQKYAAVGLAGFSGQGGLTPISLWPTAVFHAGRGQYADVLGAGTEGGEGPRCWPSLVLPELIEANARTGNTARAAALVRELGVFTRASGTRWARGSLALAQALVSTGDKAERLHSQAIGNLTGTLARFPLARARLLFGEWLRRERRIREARTELNAAREMFASMGAEPFTERVQRELAAAGEPVRDPATASAESLTPRELQVARFARDGLSNAAIGARLYISTRTVEYHMHKVLAKLGIRSRNQLDQVLT